MYMNRSMCIAFDAIIIIHINFVKILVFLTVFCTLIMMCVITTPMTFDFLLILTYLASCMQNLEIVHPLIKKKSK